MPFPAGISLLPPPSRMQLNRHGQTWTRRLNEGRPKDKDTDGREQTSLRTLSVPRAYCTAGTHTAELRVRNSRRVHKKKTDQAGPQF